LNSASLANLNKLFDNVCVACRTCYGDHPPVSRFGCRKNKKLLFFLLFMKNVQKDQHVYFRGEERKEEEKSSTSDKSAHHHRHTSPPPPTHAVTTRKGRNYALNNTAEEHFSTRRCRTHLPKCAGTSQTLACAPHKLVTFFI